jgi:hypothetical protein
MYERALGPLDGSLLAEAIIPFIVDIAGPLDMARSGADLIAMSAHGRSGLGRLVFGSVAQAVLAMSRCPCSGCGPRKPRWPGGLPGKHWRSVHDGHSDHGATDVTRGPGDRVITGADVIRAVVDTDGKRS